MRIDRLTVQNFRCFDSRTFDLMPQFNVFIGTNASGKTAVLEALAIAAGSWFLGMAGHGSRPIRPTDARLIGARTGDEFTFGEQYPVVIRAEGYIEGEHLTWGRTLHDSHRRTTYGDATRLKQLAADMQNRVRNGEEVTLPVAAYYGAGRLWLPPVKDAESRTNQRLLSRLEGYRDSLDGHASPRQLMWWLERQDRIGYQQGRATTLYPIVREAMRRAVEDAIDIRFDNARLEVVVTFAERQSIPFALLSDGQRNMVALVGDLAMRMSRLNPHLGDKVLEETSGIVLIDELDLHLHPKWQRHIAEDLRCIFPKVQFIATTHSPQIVGEVEPENIFLLQSSGFVETPRQSIGMDTNYILEFLMNTTERDDETKSHLKGIAALIEKEQYTAAAQEIEKMRNNIGEFAELVRLQTRIDRIRLLSR